MAEVQQRPREPIWRLETEQTSTRPKLRDSCDACSSSKVRCDKVKPTCGRCSVRGTKCEYLVTKRSGRKRDSTKKSSVSNGTTAIESMQHASHQPPTSIESTQRASQYQSSRTPSASPPPLMLMSPHRMHIGNELNSNFIQNDAAQLLGSQALMTIMPGNQQISGDTEMSGSPNVLLPHMSRDMQSANDVFQNFDFETHFDSLPTATGDMPILDTDLFMTDSNMSHGVTSSRPLDLSAILGTNDFAVHQPIVSSTESITNQPSIASTESIARVIPSTTATTSTHDFATHPPVEEHRLDHGLVRRTSSTTSVSTHESTVGCCAPKVLKHFSVLLSPDNAAQQHTSVSIDLVQDVVQCPCHKDNYLLTLVTLAIFKILDTSHDTVRRIARQKSGNLSSRFAFPSRSAVASTANSDTEEEDAHRVAAQLVLGELQQVQRLVNLLTHRIEKPTERMSVLLNDGPDEWGQSAPSLLTLGHIKDDLRTRVRFLSSKIIQILQQD